MTSETFNLAILLSLKDAASGGLGTFEARLRSVGKEGKQTLKTLDDLRADLNKGLAIGGVGLGGLALIGKGVQIAGNFQSSMTDLRTTISQVGADGKVNFNQLGSDMMKAEAIAVRLGNALPGTTEDVLRTIQVLKQNGLQTETILNGAADAVYNLAVASGELPTDTAKNFAQFGQLFKLKPDEYKNAADVFSKLYTSSGIASGELIEAAKYFQGRSGAAIGLTGLKDAEQSIRLIGLLRKQGLEGSEAGSSLNNFFSGYISHADALKSLQKDKGIKLKFFDEKGGFAGIDNLFKQLEPLMKLTEEERVIRLKAIFGEEGMSAATAILKTGVDGWRSYNAEQEKTISLQQKNAEKAKDFNNQMEALTGSVKNLVVTGFEPLLPSLTSGVNYTNQLVGSIQGFAKENDDLTRTLATFALYGSTAVTIVGGFNAMTSAWRIFKTVSAFSKGEGILAYLNQTAEASTSVTKRVAGFSRELDTANTKVGGLSTKVSSFQKIASSPITLTLVTMAAELAITTLLQHFSEIDERIAKVAESAKTVDQTYDRLAGLGLLYNTPGNYKDKTGKDSTGEFDSLARQFVEAIKEGRTLETSLHPERAGWWESYKNLVELPYGSYTGGGQFNPRVAANRWANEGLTKGLQDPNQLARTLIELRKGGGESNLDLNDLKLIESAIKINVGSDKFNIASELARKQQGGDKSQSVISSKPFNQLFNQPFPFPQQNSQFQNPFTSKTFEGFDLNKPLASLTESINGFTVPIAKTTETFTGLQTASGDWQTSILRIKEATDNGEQGLDDFRRWLNDTQPPLNRIISSANGVSVALDSVTFKMSNWQPPAPQSPIFSPSGFSPSNLKKESNNGDSLLSLAREAETAKNQASNSAVITIPVNLTVNADKDGNIAEQVRKVLYESSRDIGNIVAREMENGRIRS